jgi:hypothetical protein
MVQISDVKYSMPMKDVESQPEKSDSLLASKKNSW